APVQRAEGPAGVLEDLAGVDAEALDGVTVTAADVIGVAQQADGGVEAHLTSGARRGSWLISSSACPNVLARAAPSVSICSGEASAMRNESHRTWWSASRSLTGQGSILTAPVLLACEKKGSRWSG